jgi:hypothetical protein
MTAFVQQDPEILIGRMSFPDAQATMDGVGEQFDPYFHTLGWRETTIGAQLGSFCVVNEESPLADLVGDYLRFRYGRDRSVMAYCVASGTIPYEIAVTRRVFAAVESISVPSIDVIVEVLT